MKVIYLKRLGFVSKVTLWWDRTQIIVHLMTYRYI